MDRKAAAFCFVLFVNSLICALALRNETVDREVRPIIENGNQLPSVSLKPEKLKETQEPDFHPRKWVSELFVQAKHEFDMDPKVNAECRRDFELYKMHLQNQSIWAVRMFESSQWPVIGIFGGQVDHLGNFDECLWVSARGVKGQYCLAQATYDFNITSVESTRRLSGAIDYPNEEESAWNAMKMYLENPVRVNRHMLTWALCIPSTCTSTELKMSLNRVLQPIFEKNGLNISVNVNPLTCKKKEATKYTPGYYYVSTLYAVIFGLTLSASVYDMLRGKEMKKKGVKEKGLLAIFTSFSAVKNFKKLVKYNPKTDYVGLHLIKVVNIMFVIYGHRFIFFIGYPKFNTEAVELYYKFSSIELIHTNVVDVFFMVSGFLMFHFGFMPMMKGGVVYMLLSVIFRWIRMVPVFGLLILFIINILPYLGSGPLWDFRVSQEVENCQASWWANLLVINNIVRTDKQCLVISWYISADIQLAVLGSILLFIVCKNRKFGAFATVMTFLTAAGVTFTVAYINQFHGLLRLYMSLLENPRNSEEFTNFYVATYTRAGPYIIGFIAGFVAYVLRERQYKFSNKQLITFTVLSIVIGEGSQYYGCFFYVFGRRYDRLESAIYAAFNRSLFALPYAVVTCMYFTSGLGKFGDIINRPFLVPLGRLTYSAFLVNTLIQLTHAASQKQVMPTSTSSNLYWLAVTDIVMSYFCGLLLHLLAEAPIANLSKLMQRKLISSFMKSRRGTSTDKIDSATSDDASDKSSQCDSKSSTPKMANEHSHSNGGYHNQSFVTNEVIPRVSESSKV